MNKLPTIASLAVISFAALASPAFAQGMSGPAASDSMAGPSHMANDTMKMDHKKPMKKSSMKHDSMATPSNSMGASGMASGDKMAAPTGGMNSTNH